MKQVLFIIGVVVLVSCRQSAGKNPIPFPKVDTVKVAFQTEQSGPFLLEAQRQIVGVLVQKDSNAPATWGQDTMYAIIIPDTVPKSKWKTQLADKNYIQEVHLPKVIHPGTSIAPKDTSLTNKK